jgi:hypothetical protein
MRYKKCEDPEVYGFGILIPVKQIYPYIEKYRSRISPFLDWVVSKQNKGNSMMAHIAIKYLGFHKNYSNAQIKKLVPELKEISKKYLPLEIDVSGLKIGTKFNNVGVLLDYKAPPLLRKFHNEVINRLGDKIDFFEDRDGKMFEHHISLGAGPKVSNNIKALRGIARESKKDDSFKVSLKDAYVFFKKEGPKVIYRSR